MTDVVNELFETEELDGTEGPPVSPVNVNLELPRLVEVNAEPLVPGLLRTGLPRRLGHRLIVKLQDGHDLIYGHDRKLDLIQV